MNPLKQKYIKELTDLVSGFPQDKCDAILELFIRGFEEMRNDEDILGVIPDEEIE